MKFKVKDPYRKVELMAKKHLFIRKCKSNMEAWAYLDHFFWETFDTIVVTRRSKEVK